MKRLLLSAALLVALSACAATPGGGDDRTPESGGVAPSGAAAVDLVGTWDVDGVDGTSWLRVDGTEFLLGADCGIVVGSWRAAQGLLVLGDWGAIDGDCGTDALPWLQRVTGFDAVDGSTRILTDAAGDTVATLTPADAPEAPQNVDPSLVAVPEVTDDLRAMLAAPEPLPEGLAPGPGGPGRWTVAGTSGAAYVEFAADGSWTGSDGCNGNGGRWVADGTGILLATSGPSTLIACDGAPVPMWLATTTTVALENDELVLFDRDGAELGRLTRG